MERTGSNWFVLAADKICETGTGIVHCSLFVAARHNFRPAIPAVEFGWAPTKAVSILPIGY